MQKKAEKINRKRLYLLRALGVLLFFVIAFLLVNLTLNYFGLLLGYIKTSLTSLAGKGPGETANDYWVFRPSYLVTPPSGLPVLITIVISLFLAFFYGWKIMKKTELLWTSLATDYRPDEIEGTSRWMTDPEMQKLLTPAYKTDLRKCKKAGLILAEDDEKYYLDTSTVNTLVLGKTRSGKGQYFVLPSIRAAALSREKPSMVVVDVKGENLANTYLTLQSEGYRIWAINYRDPLVGTGCNNMYSIIREYKKQKEMPLDDQDSSKVSELISELSYMHTHNEKSDPIWPECAQALLSAMIYYLLDFGYAHGDLDDLNMYTVRTFFLDKATTIAYLPNGGPKTVALDYLMQMQPLDSGARQQYASSKFAEGEMRGSIFSTLASNLSIYADSGIAKLTSGALDVDFSLLGADREKPTALFLIVPDEKESRHKLAAITIKQIYNDLVDVAVRTGNGGKVPRRVMFVADEIAQMPPFPNIDKMLAVSLGRNITWSLYVQSIPQLNKVYGDNETRIIMDQMTNFVYILSSDKTTNKDFSEMLGSGTRQYMTHSGDHGSVLEADHAQSHIKGRPLLLPDELNRLLPGEIIVKIDRQFPIRTHRKPYYELGLPVLELSEMGLQTMSGNKTVVMNYNDSSAQNGEEKKENKTGSGTADPDVLFKATIETQEAAAIELSALNKIINGSTSFAECLNQFDYDGALQIATELADARFLNQVEYDAIKRTIAEEQEHA